MGKFDDYINITAPLHSATTKGKLGNANEIFLEGDTKNIENEITEINSRHDELNKKHDTLNSKHESLSRTVQGIAATGGASTANNVTYNNDTSGLNAENAQDAINELQSSKFDKTSILQESGNAEDKVMSQKAVSNKLSDLSLILTNNITFSNKYALYPTYIYNSNDFNSTDLIPIEGNIIKAENLNYFGNMQTVQFLNKNKDIVDSETNKQMNSIIVQKETSPENAEYVRFCSGDINRRVYILNNISFVSGLKEKSFVSLDARTNGDGSYFKPFNNLDIAYSYKEKNIHLLSGGKYSCSKIESNYNITSDKNVTISIENAKITNSNIILNKNVTLEIVGNSTISGCTFDFRGGILKISCNQLLCEKENNIKGNASFDINNVLPEYFFSKDFVLCTNSIVNIGDDFNENTKILQYYHKQKCSLCVESMITYYEFGNSESLSHPFHFKKIYGLSKNCGFITPHYTATADSLYVRMQFIGIVDIHEISFKGCTILLGSNEEPLKECSVYNCEFMQSFVISLGNCEYNNFIQNTFDVSSIELRKQYKTTISNNYFIDRLLTHKRKQNTAYNMSFSEAYYCVIENNYIDTGITGILFLSNDTSKGFKHNNISRNKIINISEEAISFDNYNPFDIGKIIEIEYDCVVEDTNMLTTHHDSINKRIDFELSLHINSLKTNKEIVNYPKLLFYNLYNSKNGYNTVIKEVLLKSASEKDESHDYEYTSSGEYIVKINIPTTASLQSSFNGYNYSSFVNENNEINKSSEAYVNSIEYIKTCNVFNVNDIIVIQCSCSENNIMNNVIVGKNNTGNLNWSGGAILLHGSSYGNHICHNNVYGDNIKCMSYQENDNITVSASNLIKDNFINNGDILVSGFINNPIQEIMSFNNIIACNHISGKTMGILELYLQRKSIITGNIFEKIHIRNVVDSILNANILIDANNLSIEDSNHNKVSSNSWD